MAMGSAVRRVASALAVAALIVVPGAGLAHAASIADLEYSVSLPVPVYPGMASTNGSRYFVTSSDGPGATFSIPTKAPGPAVKMAGLPLATVEGMSPDGKRAYLVDWIYGRIGVLDLAKGKVTGTMSMPGKAMSGFAVGPRGSRIFVGSPSTGQILSLDSRTLAVKGRIPACKDKRAGITPVAGGDELLITCRLRGAMFVDAKSGRRLGSLPKVGGGAPAALSPDGTRAYVVGFHTFSAIDLASRSLIGQVSLVQQGDGGSEGIDGAQTPYLSPDGGRAFATVINNTVKAIDTTSLEVTALELGGKRRWTVDYQSAAVGGRLYVPSVAGVAAIDMNSATFVPGDLLPLGVPAAAGSRLVLLPTSGTGESSGYQARILKPAVAD